MTRLTGLPIKLPMLSEYMPCTVKISCHFFSLLESSSTCEPVEFVITASPICNPTFLWSLSHLPIRIRYISSKFVHHVSQDSMRYLSAAYFWNYLLMIASLRIHCKTLMFRTCLGHFLILYFWPNIELLHLVFSKEVFVQGIKIIYRKHYKWTLSY